MGKMEWYLIIYVIVIIGFRLQVLVKNDADPATAVNSVNVVTVNSSSYPNSIMKSINIMTLCLLTSGYLLFTH